MFADLGFDPEEAQHLVLRSELMRAIRKHIEDSGQTQQQAARLFGVTQPRLNMVVKGKINEFSLDALVSMLAKAGMRVEMKVKKAPARRREAGQRISASPPRELLTSAAPDRMT
ncbi:helix-turn-helix transcriptional regulator [Methyloversatilis sp. XJ19-49]|uniref:helix-turn-helix domain-containing protein n=1 Tax=Methyloversatilis sp. XJ19-49 TaxID=2963429 RepID=UPI00211CA07B|nr:helix-turn-helix domain-containing protein [Methyloversatilis sp. XJ19-49]